MIHMPIRFQKSGVFFNLIKLYNDFGLYINTKNNTRECFTPYQLGILEEEIKPDKEANKGGIIKLKEWKE